MSSEEQSNYPENTLTELLRQWNESIDLVMEIDDERANVLLNVAALTVEDINAYIEHNQEFMTSDEENFLQSSIKMKQLREQYPHLA